MANCRSGALRSLVRLIAEEADGCIRLRLAATLALALAGSLLTALAPLALQRMVDNLAAGLSAVHLGAAYLAALIAGRLLAELRPLLAGQAEQGLHARISRRYFARLLALPFAFHAGQPTGALAGTLSQASAGCRLVVTSALQCLPVLVEVATVLVVLGQSGQPALAVVFAGSAIAYALVFARGAARIGPHGRSVSGANLRVHATLADSLLNIEAIHCFDAAASMRGRFDRVTATLERSWSGLHAQRARTGLALAAVFGTSIAASMLLAADAVSRGALTIGGFVLATVYMLQMVRPLEVIGTAARDVAQAVEFARPMLDVMEMRPDETPQRSPDAPAPDMAPALAFHDVHLAYRSDRAVLCGFSLDIRAGSTVAIVGASGAGKSSIARLLLRLIDPGSGRVLWDGIDISRIDVASLRRRIGVVPQDTSLLDDTIAANIAIGCPGATPAEIEEAGRAARLQDFVESLPERYDTRVGERGLKLSGGERQRIAIARALLRRPRVFVFDEISSMLDGATEAALLRDLGAACAGCTTIVITHRLASARLADRIAVLESGRVVEEGSHAELLARGDRYARMWRSQSRDGGPPCP